MSAQPTIPLTVVGSPDPEVAREAESLVKGQTMLHLALDELRARPGPPARVRSIAQDECTFDCVLPYRAPHHLAYDCSCNGHVRGATLWDHEPTADELLAERLRRGWKPKATELVDGPRVLGHAACALDPRNFAEAPQPSHPPERLPPPS